MFLDRAAYASLALGLTLAASAAHAQDAAADGQRLFQSRCGACHAVQAGQNRVGPSLAGVFGRKAGEVAGARYSAALKGADIIWDEAALDAYLDNPRGLVPNTTMTVSLRDAAQRSAVIAYLRTLTVP